MTILAASRRRELRWAAIAAAAVILLTAALAPPPAGAAEPKSYQYMRVQGRIGELPGESPISGVVVRLRSAGGVFEAATDVRGVFVFDELPVEVYDVELATADGKVLRKARSLPYGGTSRARVEFRFGRGTPAPIRVEPGGEGVSITVPRHTDWQKVWAEFAVFGGIALLLAL